MKTIKIGTRKSQLALWQAHFVRDALLKVHDDIKVELVEIVSEGDRTLDVPLSEAGGKGLFLKELETALLSREIDLAVHSMKDVTVRLPEGLHIPVVGPREEPRDALVSNTCSRLDELPRGAVVGTCSLRRRCQLLAARPDLEIRNLRGNVNTRLARLDDGQYDAIVLAAAGLIRLNMTERIANLIDTGIMLPAVGQGIVGIECRCDDPETNARIMLLNDSAAAWRITAERAANSLLDGGCHHPVAVYSEIDGDQLWIRGLVGALDGSRIIRSERRGPVRDAHDLGRQVARALLDQGAEKILHG